MSRFFLFGAVVLILVSFLILPLGATLCDAVYEKGRFTLVYLLLTVSDPYLRGLLVNSLWLAFLVTLFSSLIALPAAATLARWTFPGRSLLTLMLLSPLIIPPFVGALGLRHILGRFGPINMILIELGLSRSGVDWLGSGRLLGVAVVEILHFFPLMLLMLLGPMALTRGTVEEAATGLGAGSLMRMRKVLFPMIRPSLIAGMLIVFLWSLTDLGAPLVFDYRYLLPVKIFDLTGEIGASPVGSALVVVLLVVVLAIFVVTRWVLGRQVEWRSVRESAARPKPLSGWPLAGRLAWMIPLALIGMLPHVAILLASVADQWFLSVLPKSWTLDFYGKTLRDPLCLSGLSNSIWMSLSAMGIDIVVALVIVHLVVRRKVKGGAILDLVSSLPLAIPGVLLAFGYLSLFLGTPLSPMRTAGPILVMAYATRRLPYMVRSIAAGASAIPPTWEEAGRSLGGSNLRVWRRITVPLLMPNILAGAIMVFILSLLEVGCSLVLAFREEQYPLTKSLWALFARATQGAPMACALGVLSMIFLTFGLVVAARMLGRKIGDLFRPV